MTKEDVMSQYVMKTVSGPPQLCHAKVIQTLLKQHDGFLFIYERAEMYFQFCLSCLIL